MPALHAPNSDASTACCTRGYNAKRTAFSGVAFKSLGRARTPPALKVFDTAVKRDVRSTTADDEEMPCSFVFTVSIGWLTRTDP
ncbi:hypothetical protein DIPPA_15390 [Diplonema papillatum]|nr:hypothetical protein DIPPA_15390 [Diplonema papillatum]